MSVTSDGRLSIYWKAPNLGLPRRDGGRIGRIRSPSLSVGPGLEHAEGPVPAEARPDALERPHGGCNETVWDPYFILLLHRNFGGLLLGCTEDSDGESARMFRI